MAKKLREGSNHLRAVYWSMVGMFSMTLISLQTVLAAKDKGGDTIWNRFSTIMRDVKLWYNRPHCSIPGEKPLGKGRRSTQEPGAGTHPMTF